MKADAKKVLIAMIKKSADNSANELLRQKEEDRIQKIRVAEFVKLVYANAALYLEQGYHTSDLDDVDFTVSKAGEKLRDQIEKRYPLQSEELTENVVFNALSFTLECTKSQVKKYQKLADEIDEAVVTGEAVDIFNLLKKALG